MNHATTKTTSITIDQNTDPMNFPRKSSLLTLAAETVIVATTKLTAANTPSRGKNTMT